ncbi:tetratricopeptide repeat protein [bacterium]|nr:tetratricopeptide repeat protein [bacterium]
MTEGEEKKIDTEETSSKEAALDSISEPVAETAPAKTVSTVSMDELQKKRSPVKLLVTTILMLLIALGVGFAIPNAMWFYYIQSGSQNMDALKLEESAKDFETAATIARFFPSGDERLGLSLNTLGTMQLALGRYKEAGKTIDESITIHKRLYGEGVKSTKALLLKAGLNRRQGNYKEAEEIYNNALDTIESAEGKNAKYAEVLMVLSILEIYRGNYARAEAGFLEVTSIHKELEGAKYKEPPDMTMNLGRIAEAKGDYKTAGDLYQKCLKELGAPDENNKASHCLVLNLMAELYITENDTKEAGASVEKAYALAQSLSAKEYLQAANLETLMNLTSFHIMEDQYDKAEKILKQSLPIARDRLGKNHPAYARVLSQQAEVLAYKNKFKEADADALEAIALMKETVGDTHRYVADLMRSRAKVLTRQKNFDEADTVLKQSLNLFAECLSAKHPEYANTLMAQAKLAEAKGNSARAAELMARARKIVEAANKR